MLGRELPTEEAIIEVTVDLLDFGVEVVIISRGKEGIIGATRGSIFKAIPPQVKVRRGLGAGACAVAGLALKLAYGESLIEACKLVVAMGTAAVITPGTELCHKADVEIILSQVKVWGMPARRRSKVFFPVSSNL